MTDDDQVVRAAARKKLDVAIGEYAVAINRGDDAILGVVGAWVVAIYSPTTDEGRDAYVVESAENQPWHASIGLARYTQLHYETTGDGE